MIAPLTWPGLAAPADADRRPARDAEGRASSPHGVDQATPTSTTGAPMSGKPTPDDTTAYPKVPGPFWRDPATNQLTDQWSSPELEATAPLPWQWTEKIDGTNIRIIWDGYRVTFAGRTLRAHLPIPLHSWLVERFGGPEREQLFEQKFGVTPVVLYGEGMGAGIQNGGKYDPEMTVALFDVLVDQRWWLRRDDVAEIADYFDVGITPGMGIRTLDDAIAHIRSAGLQSAFGVFPAEGLVGTTVAGLRGRDGQRIIVKLKTRDLSPASPAVQLEQAHA